MNNTHHQLKLSNHIEDLISHLSAIEFRDFVALCFLVCRDNVVLVSRKELSERLQCTPETIRRRLQALKEKGLVHVYRQDKREIMLIIHPYYVWYGDYTRYNQVKRAIMSPHNMWWDVVDTALLNKSLDTVDKQE